MPIRHQLRYWRKEVRDYLEREIRERAFRRIRGSGGLAPTAGYQIALRSAQWFGRKMSQRLVTQMRHCIGCLPTQFTAHRFT